MKRWIGIFLFLSAIVLLVPTPGAYAQPGSGVAPAAPTYWSFTGTEATGEIAATQMVTGTMPMTGTVRIATLVAAYFNRNVEDILALHAGEIGFGVIAKALFTAVEANVPLEQILEMHLQEIGWGDIRKELGLSPGMPHQSLGTIASQGRGPNKDANWVPPGLLKQQEAGKAIGKGRLNTP